MSSFSGRPSAGPRMSQAGNTNSAREAKVVLLGDAGVGKSSLVLRFVNNNFRPFSEATIGASFMSKMIKVDGSLIKFQIWDTAGQEKYHSLAPMYYRNAAAAIIVYDITRKETFRTLKTWVEELKNRGPQDIAICIAGNKCDLENERKIPKGKVQEYCDQNGFLFVETSAKDDVNVQQIFIDLSKKISPAETANNNSKVAVQATTSREQQKSACC